MTVFASQTLKGEHALITGATGGIGYETAKVLAGMGAALTLTGRRKEKLEELEREIKASHQTAQVKSYAADLSIEAEREVLIETAEKSNGFISLLINSAGIAGGGLVEDLTEAEIEEVMYFNYTVPVLLSKQVYRKMKENKKGAIVNVSSLSGLRGTYGNTAYAASKFALEGFTHSFSLEAIRHNVRVNAVCPGYVNTDMGRAAINRKAEANQRSFEEQFELAAQGLPSGRITEPEEVANTIAFLLTSAAANIVGESVKISGGAVLR